MAFNISEIKSTLNRYGGPARTSHFDVTITNPRSLSTAGNGMSTRDLVFFAEAAEVPGVSLQTSEIRHGGYGFPDKRPYRTGFVDVNIRFVEDAEAKSLTFFQKWVDSIAKFSDRGSSAKDTYLYPDEYQTTLNIKQYDTSGQIILDCKIFEAYPMTIVPISLDWASQNEIAKFTVSFAYGSWTTNKI